MLRRWRLGRIAGFPIEVNLSFLLLLAVVLIAAGGVSGVLVVLLAFASVLLHELGHALVARHLGVEVAGIELHVFGGAAKMGQPDRAGDEIAIAAAGPAVSFALGGIGLVLSAATGAYVFSLLAWINVVIGAFNLIPALPMDGGRIFRALLSRKLSFARATGVAVKVSRGFAIALAAFGLVSVQIYLVLLAGLLWFMGTNELKMLRRVPGYGYGYVSGPRAPHGYSRAAHRDPEVEVLPRGFAYRIRFTRPATRR